MYYRLTYKSSSDRTRTGDSVINGSRPLNIGDGASSDVRLIDSEQYEPQVYATILPDEDGKGWYIVRRTDCHQVLVNGKEVAIAQSLDSGDRLCFLDGKSRTELLFEVFNNGDFDSRIGLVYQKHKSEKFTTATALVLALMAVGAAIYGIFSSRQKDLSHEDLLPFRQAIYQITTDSLYLMHDSVIDGMCSQVVVEAIELEQASVGTAFLTTDSLFVTARHCIEPWLNDVEWDGVSAEKMSADVRLAVMAETGNVKAGDEKYSLRSHCVVSRGLERHDFYSTDFTMDKSRDLVMQLGTRQEPAYWRTILPIAHRRDMELGDIAWVKASNLTNEGVVSLSLADEEDISSFAKSGNHNIAVLGFPLNDNDVDDAAVIYGHLMDFSDELDVSEGCLRLSASINPGNSGGPVLALTKQGVKVIGIVSKADDRATQGLFWAVPVTALPDSIQEETPKYRRL